MPAPGATSSTRPKSVYVRERLWRTIRSQKTTLGRLMEKVEISSDGCWLFRGAHDRLGYGQMRVGGITKRVYRLTFEWTYGPIPTGLTVDHLCRVPACCNPKHLEAVSMAENTRRGLSHAPTIICKRGHPRTPENTIVAKTKRQCLPCQILTTKIRLAQKAGRNA